MENGQNHDRLASLHRKEPKRSPDNQHHIRLAKMILPLLVVACGASVLGWILIYKERFDVVPAEIALKTILKNELLNPRYESVDNKGQPFTITAARAIRGSNDEQIVTLDEPKGDIELQNGRWLSINANTGLYNQAAQRLMLSDNVQLFDNEGYTLETEKMNIDMKTQKILADYKVYGQGPTGIIRAAGMYSDVEQGLLSFKGPATLTLYVKDNQSSLESLK